MTREQSTACIPRSCNRELAALNRHRTRQSLWLLLRRYSPRLDLDYRTTMHGIKR